MDPFPTQAKLSADEATLLAGQVASLSHAGLPLAAGLRAMAEEAPSSRLVESFRICAEHLERGESLDNSLAALGSRLPSAMRGLIAAASRSGRLGSVLLEMLEQQRRQRAMLREITAALRYPLVVFVLSLVVAFAIPIFVADQLGPLLRDFDLKLSYGSKLMLWLGEAAGLWLLLAVGCAVVMVGVARVVAGETWWRGAWSRVPIIGPLWRWSGLAELSRLLAALLDAGLPLPDALVTAGEGVADTSVVETAHELAEGVRQGSAFSQTLRTAPRVPRMLLPVIEWGERSAALPEALRTVAQVLEARVRGRARWLRMTLPPILFVLIGVTVLGCIVNLLLPLIDLINKLTGG